MSASVIRAALFVDFDQVFGGLHRVRPEAAEQFATQPDRWLRFFEQGQHATMSEDGIGHVRNILVRKCYLNPGGSIRTPGAGQPRTGRHGMEWQAAFGRYRAYFTRAGFSVVDCPPLTSRGKNSSDIVMVMDIIDALRHETRFDEFIILSGDADFAPVLLRLREHDRRTAILADMLTAAAYRAACDYQVGQDDFIARAMGMDAPDQEAPTAAVTTEHTDLMRTVARAVADYLRQNGEQQINHLVAVFVQFPQFRDSAWFGAGALTRLMDELARIEPAILIDKRDPRLWMARSAEPGPPAAEAAEGVGAVTAEPAEVRVRILETVRGILANETEPMVLSALAQAVMASVPEVANGRWPNGERFSDILRASHDPHIAILPRAPGYAYDPIMHPVREVAAASEVPASAPSDALRNLIGKVSTVSGCPNLTPLEYGALFSPLAAELRRLSDPPVPTWTQYYLCTIVYEKCAEAGAYIARDAISFVLTGLENEAYDWHAKAEEHTPMGLAVAFRDNIETLCENARLELSDDEFDLLDDWICGSLDAADESETALQTEETDATKSPPVTQQATDPAAGDRAIGEPVAEERDEERDISDCATDAIVDR